MPTLKTTARLVTPSPFVAVQDGACTECHKGLRDHAKAGDMKTTHPKAAGFDAQLGKISEMFGRPIDRCASCHVEHNTREKMIPADQGLCADCHRDLDKHLPATKLKNVSDFGSGHPEFRP